MTSDLSRWVVYSRPECSLCEEFVQSLAAVLGSAAERVRVANIEESADLLQKYGSKTPLLMIDGELVCAYRVDPQRVKAHLAI
jgi:predicted thioredoxin/glutaredoxin